MADDKELSLYRELNASGYEASVIATFNVRFSLYERVLLRRLLAAGCRYNLLLADAAQCGTSLSMGEDVPELAGSEYALVPIQAQGAFHPKFVLLLGRTKARLIVGSHNVSVGGFGLNREIATAFDIDPSGASADLAKEVWQFARAWASQVPGEVGALLTAVHQIAPWLADSPASAGNRRLLWTGAGRKTLWEQLRPSLDRRVERVTVLSPYFDNSCTFMKRVLRDLAPRETVIAIDPESSEFPVASRRFLPDARFVDVSSLGGGWTRTLHAKVYRFEFRDGESLVVSGSANASQAAWLSVGATGNAEMVVMHANGNHVWKSLGLARLGKLPDVSADTWRTMKTRQEHAAETDASSTVRVFHAVVRSDGFEVRREFTEGIKGKVDVLAGAEVLGQLSPVSIAHGLIACRTDDSPLLQEATVLRARSQRGPERFALLSRVDELCDRAAGSLRQNFRRALSGLQGDPEQITELLKIIEKAIFDQPFAVEDVASPAARATSRTATAPPNEDAEPASLMVSARDTLKARRKRRLTASTDLAVIIDALIYRLGNGLHREDLDTKESVRVHEPKADDHGADDDEPEEVDGAVLAKMCRGKVNRLFKRMQQQLDQAAERGTHVGSAIIQLAAVLGIVKALTVGTFEWLPPKEELVDGPSGWEFFTNACRSLYAPGVRLAARALEETAGTAFDELSIVRGLLCWFAFTWDVDVETLARNIKEYPDYEWDYLIGVACLLPVATDCAADNQAIGLLGDALSASSADVAKADRHLSWARRIDEKWRTRGLTPIQGGFKLGDVVFPVKASTGRPGVVCSIEHDKTGVLNLDTLAPTKFANGWLARL